MLFREPDWRKNEYPSGVRKRSLGMESASTRAGLPHGIQVIHVVSEVQGSVVVAVIAQEEIGHGSLGRDGPHGRMRGDGGHRRGEAGIGDAPCHARRYGRGRS